MALHVNCIILPHCGPHASLQESGLMQQQQQQLEEQQEGQLLL
jgi:hypothetical protein